MVYCTWNDQVFGLCPCFLKNTTFRKQIKFPKCCVFEKTLNDGQSPRTWSFRDCTSLFDLMCHLEVRKRTLTWQNFYKLRSSPLQLCAVKLTMLSHGALMCSAVSEVLPRPSLQHHVTQYQGIQHQTTGRSAERKSAVAYFKDTIAFVWRDWGKSQKVR
jgi:hypothetical protein